MKPIHIYLNPDYTMDDLRAMPDNDVTGIPIHIACVLTAICLRFTAHKPYPRSDKWVLWASESRGNYELLWNYGMDLLEIHHEKFGAPGRYKHSSTSAMEKLGSIPARVPVGEETPPPQLAREV